MAMRKVVLYELLTIDGVAEEPGNWLFEGDDGLMANLADVIGRQDDVLLGRGTYDYWSGYWPTADVQPFADFINGTPKHVFTSSRPEAAWEGSTFIDGPAEKHVEELKRGDGGDIGIHGSITLAQSLLRAGLVDELRLIVAPTVAASGRRLFADGGELQRFELLEARGTSAGLTLLAYAKRA
jgi:dihydrofolate reductase